MRKKLPPIFLFLLVSIYSIGQDLGQIGKAKLIKVNGGISSNAIYYDGIANRDPFTYFLSGNVNVNISGIYNIPLSFTYSNQEFQTNRPFSFNRLSLYPSYKWIATHIGDVSMSFSPYTLSGHQFTGFGVDLTPKGPFKISAMYGRLLKEAEYNEEDPQSQPAYKRMGYGLKASYEFSSFDVGLTLFKATDQENSITNPVPVELGLTPKENAVVSFEGNVSLFDKAQLHLEVASSAVTEDINAVGETAASNPTNALIQSNVTTQNYLAYNANVTYPVANGTVGAGYERIDPNYRTFGAYFFNNDMENITINASQNLFESKVNVAINAGLQRDDLDNAKSTQLKRIVSAVNVGYNATEKLNYTGGYSNFQSFTNIKNQFDFINEVSQADNLDTLDFQQISQNANFGANYQLVDTKTKKQNINLNLSLQNAISRQGGNITENGNSNFYNASTAYTLGYPERNLQISAAANASYNTIGFENSLTIGPTIAVNKQFFDKKLRTTASTSYNQSQNNGAKHSEVVNIRLNGGYVYKKKHNINLSVLTQLRNSIVSDAATDFTATLSYSYTFDNFKPKIKFPKREERPDNGERISFKYRDSVFEGTKTQITQQLKNLLYHKHFSTIPSSKKDELVILHKIVEEERKDTNSYKEKAIIFLDQLYSYEDFLSSYTDLVKTTITNLWDDMQRIDYALEKGFVATKVQVDEHPLHQKKRSEISAAQQSAYQDYQKLVTQIKDRQQKLVSHRWLLPIIGGYAKFGGMDKPGKILQEFMNLEKNKVYRMQSNAPDTKKIQVYLESQLIDFYYKKSLKETDPDKFELKYTLKN